MNAVTTRDRWQNAFVYALVTTVMVLSAAMLLSFYLGGAQRALAERVDTNAAVSVTASDAIICILQLGVGPESPPRTDQNVNECLRDSGYIDIPTVQLPGEGE